MDLLQFSECISKNFILKHADEKSILRVFECGGYHDVEFRAGDVILSPENSQHSVGLVLCGKVTAEPCGGDNALLRLLDVGDMFGIANLYAEDEAFPSIIKAKTAAHILFIDSDRFKELLETDSRALRAYLSFMSRKIVYLNKKIATLTAGSAEKKLALYLCENQCDGIFSSDASMSAIAELLGVGRASLYRAVDTLVGSGAITKNGKTIIINDINALLNI